MEKLKYKASTEFSVLAKDWDGSGPKVKLRVPTVSRGKREYLFVPGDVLGSSDPKTQKSLAEWVPPPITIDGQPWHPREKLFTLTNDPETKDLDN